MDQRGTCFVKFWRRLALEAVSMEDMAVDVIVPIRDTIDHKEDSTGDSMDLPEVVSILVNEVMETFPDQLHQYKITMLFSVFHEQHRLLK